MTGYISHLKNLNSCRSFFSFTASHETLASLFLWLEASTIRFPEILNYYTLLLLLPASHSL
ncbi:hypothetical protein HanIR_Chr05g0249041 [Helianthus annuus]|nr:hypothetical protein HanIR_Chr05g0249041 [Helianthus annuus]